jgi:hypothetical protein
MKGYGAAGNGTTNWCVAGRKHLLRNCNCTTVISIQHSNVITKRLKGSHKPTGRSTNTNTHTHTTSWSKGFHYCFIFGRSCFQTSGRRPTIYTAVVRVYPQSLRTTTGIVTKTASFHISSNSFSFLQFALLGASLSKPQIPTPMNLNKTVSVGVT